jgi:hypothetical protein
MRWFERPFPGSERNQHWFMLRSERQLEQFAQEPWAAFRARAFLADRIPSDVDLDSVKALCIEDQFHLETQCADVPACVHWFRSLEYLRLPKKYIPQLRQDSIPDSVRVLETVGDGLARFPEGISVPNVVRLVGGYVALQFTPKTFPRLKHLDLRLDSRRTMLAVLSELSQLQTLSIGPNRDGEVFGAVGAKALAVLNLAGGAIETLAGIERLRSLRAVGLRSLDKLKDISSLARLPKLQDVMITWCARLAAFDPLLQLASLEYLDIFGCKSFRSEEYALALAERNLKGLSLPAG